MRPHHHQAGHSHPRHHRSNLQNLGHFIDDPGLLPRINEPHQSQVLGAAISGAGNLGLNQFLLLLQRKTPQEDLQHSRPSHHLEPLVRNFLLRADHHLPRGQLLRA